MYNHHAPHRNPNPMPRGSKFPKPIVEMDKEEKRQCYDMNAYGIVAWAKQQLRQLDLALDFPYSVPNRFYIQIDKEACPRSHDPITNHFPPIISPEHELLRETNDERDAKVRKTESSLGVCEEIKLQENGSKDDEELFSPKKSLDTILQCEEKLHS